MVRSLILSTVLYGLTANLVHATLGVETLEVQSQGKFTFNGAKFSVVHWDQDWKRATQDLLSVEKEFPKSTEQVWTVCGTLSGASADSEEIQLKLREELTRETREKFLVSLKTDVAETWPTRLVCLEISLPSRSVSGYEVNLDGRRIALPEKIGDAPIFPETTVKTMTLPSANGLGEIVIEGDFKVSGQDSRKWNTSSYDFRIALSAKGSPTVLSISYRPYKVVPLSLADAVNSKHSGKITDNPDPAFDLSSFPEGSFRFGSAVHFQTTFNSVNGSKGSLILEPGMSVKIPWKYGDSLHHLYLLHAASGAPRNETVGAISVLYANGTEKQIPVIGGKDVGNWRDPSQSSNGLVAWTGEDATGAIGLNASHFFLGDQPVRELTFSNSSVAKWIIVGLTVSDENIPLTATKLVSRADRQWAPYDLRLQIDSGSIFDQSSFNEAPAGKNGRVIVTPDGHFAFENEPNQRVKFYGVNTCFQMNYLEKEKADLLAMTLARSGYNAVRMHHYDGLLVEKNGKPGQLDPDQLDRLDYYFAALKKNGIYTTIDLFTIRKITEQQVPAIGKSPSSLLKVLVAVSDQAFDVWAGFAKALLLHKNPYTGLTWAEDPALFGICPLNEDTIYWAVRDKAARDVLSPYYERWKVRKAVAGDPEAVTYNRFLTETAQRSNARIFSFLRSLGVKALLTGSNNMNSQAEVLLRQHYDYVDNHEYWNHPTFPSTSWGLPAALSQASSIKTNAWLPRTIMPSRLFGKPYTVTEFNYVWPNARRAEGGALMAAYSSLQDWDALFNFSYGDDRQQFPSTVNSHFFDITADPINLLADRVAAILFLRGGIRFAPTAICYAVDADTAHIQDGKEPKQFPLSFSKLGFVVRIGSLPGSSKDILSSPVKDSENIQAIVIDPNERSHGDGRNVFSADENLIEKLVSAKMISANCYDPTKNRYLSETNQIEMAGKDGILKVVTPVAECFALEAGVTQQGNIAKVRNGSSYGCIYIVAADDKPLQISKRILVVHLTDSRNTGTVFSDQTCTFLEDYGRLPHLVKRGEAELSLRIVQKLVHWKVWAVDAQGSRLREVPSKIIEGNLTFEAQTTTPKGTVLAYELVAESVASGAQPSQNSKNE
ncbi:hypothetical protein BH09VER1_BH09VER1_14040 [soil metagenome]